MTSKHCMVFFQVYKSIRTVREKLQSALFIKKYSKYTNMICCYATKGKICNTENICFINLCFRGHLCLSETDSCFLNKMFYHLISVT